jgi:predicted dienelactone hydrolase
VRSALAWLALVVLATPAGAAGLAGAGRWPVASTTVVFTRDGRTLPTEVWYPARTAARDVPPRRGRFPLVLVVHGHCGFRTNYEYLTTALAAAGFVVAAPDFPGFTKADCDAGLPIGDVAGDVPRDLEAMRAAFAGAAPPVEAFRRAVRARFTGAVGHSLATIGVLPPAPRFRAVVVLAPIGSPWKTSDFLPIARPARAVMAIGGTADTTLPFASQTAPLFDVLPAPAYLVKIVGGTHSGFTDMDSRLDPAALARQEALVVRYATAFFQRHLKGRKRFGRYLKPADAAAQGPDVELTARLR